MKKIFEKARSVIIEIDDALPEIRDTWCDVRDGVWAYVKGTLIVTATIFGIGFAVGLAGTGYALLSSAHADTIFGDVEDCSRARRCGYMKPVYHAKPLSAGGGYEFSGTWEGATAQGYNPRISCPPGLVQISPSGGAEGAVDQDYTCWNINAPPAPWPAQVTVTPIDNCDLYVRGCGSVELWPLHDGQYWGHWPGGWDPKYGCPPGYGKKVQDFTYANLGVYRFTCKVI